jgi:hypothetical protein
MRNCTAPIIAVLLLGRLCVGSAFLVSFVTHVEESLVRGIESHFKIDNIDLSVPHDDSRDADDDIFRRSTADIREAASALHKVRPATTCMFGVLSVTATAIGSGHLALLAMGLKGAETGLAEMGKAMALPEECARFQRRLDSIRETLDCTLEECSLDGYGGEDGEDVPPQVLELTTLVAEGEEYIRGLVDTENYVSTLTKQLLQRNACPASKLSQLSEKMQEAVSKLQLHKAIRLVERQNREEANELRAQMEQLRQSMEDLLAARDETAMETPSAQETHELLRQAPGQTHGRKRRALMNLLFGTERGSKEESVVTRAV